MGGLKKLAVGEVRKIYSVPTSYNLRNSNVIGRVWRQSKNTYCWRLESTARHLYNDIAWWGKASTHSQAIQRLYSCYRGRMHEIGQRTRMSMHTNSFAGPRQAKAFKDKLEGLYPHQQEIVVQSYSYNPKLKLLDASTRLGVTKATFAAIS